MKKILRFFVVDTLSLYIIANSTTGIILQNGLFTLLLAGLGLSLASVVVRPIINILLLPINLITFNLFKWASSAIALYIVTLVVPGFIIEGFYFAGFSGKWFDIPTIALSGFLAFVAISFILSFLSAIISLLIK
ncbi:hypothetical protein A3E15_01585 [Candidatus Woesebacteria bacterium RIFCSPHIGHO2_12_FULL_42_9]|uniref:Phage holin family protein n=3 Tax=Candidatus Woeseibacteriota TaxID=1752722 RepID=A0A1F8AXJ2_9BACT|nr:MAG: hypothetical protein A2112_01870 [Candidatus Woesebacteria bacterium GWA1_42_12]OGM06198.1 MAG: hypothetical protein A2129_00060 [Candidatus Woesebacteria bacterium GWC1_42_13]OGM56360.1 MAG: hypothetical protein A3E15_01585 [Candidatus Woesebacteria bacterium RIFCSPHIGHO2_12_FULL_42_9]